MTPNSGAASIRRTRKPLRASASDTAAPPRPAPTTSIGSELRVTAAPRITSQANPLGVKGESRARQSAPRRLQGVTKKTQNAAQCWTDSGGLNGRSSRRDAEPLDLPVEFDA